jgi:ABC-type uncharacterized transport system substrate-binding protein
MSTRRDFITLLGGAAAAWPLAARAQQPERVRRIGALMPFTADDAEGKAIVAALRRGLQELGWTDGRNIRVEYRWGGRNVERTRAYAAELVDLSPDLIFAFFNAQLGPLSRETRTIPIVFVGASDPVGAGYVASFARPGGNITGFTLYEPSFVGKSLGVLKETVPAVARVAIMVNPDTAILRGTFYLREFETAAATFKVEPITTKVHSTSDIEAAIMVLGQQPVPTGNPTRLTVATNRVIIHAMGELCRLILCVAAGLFRSRAALHAEIFVLRHQLNVLRRKSPKRLAFNNIDRFVFAGLYSLTPNVTA